MLVSAYNNNNSRCTIGLSLNYTLLIAFAMKINKKLNNCDDYFDDRHTTVFDNCICNSMHTLAELLNPFHPTQSNPFHSSIHSPHLVPFVFQFNHFIYISLEVNKLKLQLNVGRTKLINVLTTTIIIRGIS